MTTSGGSAGTEAASSQSSAQVSNKVVRSNVFTMAKPKAAASKSESTEGGEQTAMSRAMQNAGADIFYNSWEAGGSDGKTYGINPSYSIGDKHAITVTVPLYATSPDEGDGYKTVGVDGLYKFNMSDSFSLGAHLNYLKVSLLQKSDFQSRSRRVKKFYRRHIIDMTRIKI